MPKYNIFKAKFADIYPMYVQKAERKSRSKREVNQIICWLSGYDLAGLADQLQSGVDVETFFAWMSVMNRESSDIQ